MTIFDGDLRRVMEAWAVAEDPCPECGQDWLSVHYLTTVVCAACGWEEDELDRISLDPQDYTDGASR